jgi:chromosome segregation ATPase
LKGNGKAYTLQEASEITGLKVQTIRMRIKSGKLEAFKNPSKHGEAWLIKPQSLREIEKIDNIGLKVQEGSKMNPSSLNPSSLRGELQEPLIEAYKEHITTLKGTLQNFEGLLTTFQQRVMNLEVEKAEMENKLNLLPAPPEVVTKELQEKDQALQQKATALAQAEKIVEEARETQKRYIEAMEELKAKLLEEERVKEAYRAQWEGAQAELSRPWWKKLFGVK